MLGWMVDGVCNEKYLNGRYSGLSTGVTGVEPAESRFGDDRLNRWAPPLCCVMIIAEREGFVNVSAAKLSLL